MNRYFVTVRPQRNSTESLTLSVDATDVFDARDKAVRSAHWYNGAVADAVRIVAA
jgi:hypothetical protein